MATGVLLRFALVHKNVEARLRSELSNITRDLVGLGTAGRRGDEEREHQMTAHDDLLDIEDGDVVLGEDSAHPTGDTRTVLTREDEQESAGGCVVHLAQTSANRGDGSA